LAAELADRQTRLELLDAGGDPYAAVREVFSWSVQQLPADAARTFRLLGLHPGPDLDPYAVAALTGLGVDQARRALELLARAHLVHRTGRGRYGVHDLLRAYATELATTEETDQQRTEAETRLRDHYLAAATSAMDTLHPAEAHWRPDRRASTAVLPDLTDPGSAGGWLESERFCLVATAAQAAARGDSGYVVDLARVLYRYLSAAHLTEQLAINGHALQAAEHAGDLLGTAHALRHLCTAYVSSGRYERAIEYGRLARARFERAGDRVGEGLARLALAVAESRTGDHQQAIDDYRQAIVVFREAGDRLGEASGFTNLGVLNAGLTRLTEAADDNRQALAIYRELGSRHHEGLTLGNLADVELRQGEHASAGEHLRQALGIVRELDMPITEAFVLDALGRLHLRLRQPEEATGYLRQAVTLCRTTGERYGQSWTLNSLGEAARLAGGAAEGGTGHRHRDRHPSPAGPCSCRPRPRPRGARRRGSGEGPVPRGVRGLRRAGRARCRGRPRRHRQARRSGRAAGNAAPPVEGGSVTDRSGCRVVDPVIPCRPGRSARRGAGPRAQQADPCPGPRRRQRGDHRSGP
jgi:tetratricopeptide (TPR) repeat protein